MRGHVRRRTHTTKTGKTTTTWYVVVDLPRSASGRRQQKWHGGFRTRREAEAAQARIVHELATGDYVHANECTLAEWIDDHWLPSVRMRVKPSTHESYRSSLHLHVLPKLGQQRLTDITPSMLDALYAGLFSHGRILSEAGLSAKTVSNIHAAVHKALADAVDAQLIRRNPATGAKPPRPRTQGNCEIRSWTPSQLKGFLSSVEGHRLATAWLLAAMTGMRRGEVLGTRWQDIDVKERTISVRRALIAVGYDVQVSTPKGGRPRLVDLAPSTVARLEAHRQQQLSEKRRWGREYNDQDLVFCLEDGSPVHPHAFSSAFQKAVRDSGRPRIRLHDLRHTHATIALRAGIPIKVIAERLGHADPAFTMKQYAHVIPGMQAEAAQIFAEIVHRAPNNSDS